MLLNLVLFVMAGFLYMNLVSSHPVDCQLCYKNPHRPRTAVAATDYLRRYGFLKDSCYFNPVRFSYTDKLLEAIVSFQEWNDLKITGKLDKQTLNLMGTDRCGVPDIISDFSVTIVSTRKRGKRTTNVLARRWRKTDLTYRIARYCDDLTPGVLEGIIREAWKIWSDVTPLTFTQVDDVMEDVDMEISFVTGVHGDADPFDGPGGVVAHAFYPGKANVPLSGDTHFDDDERWTLYLEETGRRLFCVAIHEFGHALGLEHTNRKDSVMYPFKRECGNGSLSDYDMVRIQGIYGPNTETGITPSPNFTMPATTTQTPLTTANQTAETTFMTSDTPETDEPVCTTTVINTCTTTVGTTSTLETTTPMMSSPMTTYMNTTRTDATTTTTAMTTAMATAMTTTRHPWCPGDGKLDAIDVAGDGNTYGFKGRKIYQFTSEGVVDGFPKLISSVFPDSPLTVDAAVTVVTKVLFTKKIRTYLFKANKVWKYIYQSHWGHPKFILRRGYPKYIKDKFGISVKRIDAAFNLKRHKRIYLTEGDKVWQIKFMAFGDPRASSPFSLKQHPTLKHLKHVDSVVRYTNGAYYFFDGDYYDRLVPSGSIGRWTHPRYTLLWWFDCKPPGTEQVPRPAGDSKDAQWAKTVNMKDL